MSAGTGIYTSLGRSMGPHLPARSVHPRHGVSRGHHPGTLRR